MNVGKATCTSHCSVTLPVSGVVISYYLFGLKKGLQLQYVIVYQNVIKFH